MHHPCKCCHSEKTPCVRSCGNTNCATCIAAGVSCEFNAKAEAVRDELEAAKNMGYITVGMTIDSLVKQLSDFYDLLPTRESGGLKVVLSFADETLRSVIDSFTGVCGVGMAGPGPATMACF
jgi:hypothetical protein